MIKLIEMEDPRMRWKFLSETDFERSCFLVSDIKSKQRAEEWLLEERGFLSGQPVMRVRDFLKLIFRQTHPSWRIVSQALLRERFSNHEGDFLPWLNIFLPVISHPESNSLLREWLKDKGNSAGRRWESRYLAAESFFHFLQEKKWIHEEGVKGLLLNQQPDFTGLLAPPKKIIADLGIHFDFCEQEILRALSRRLEVVFLIPSLQKKMPGGPLPFYKFLKEATPPSEKIRQRKQDDAARFFKREYLSALEEAGEAVARVRLWLDQGVEMEDIAFLAPDMERYWPYIHPCLLRKNIKVKKSVTARLTDFPEVMSWLSSLKVHIGKGGFSDMELKAFYKDPPLPFSRFQSLFFQAPERELSKKRLCRKDRVRDPEQTVSGREFAEWAVSLWPDDSPVVGISSIFQEIPLEESLSYSAWTKVLEEGLFRRETELKGEEAGGVSCLSLNAGYSVRASHIVVMGLNEESLRDETGRLLSQRDFELMIGDLGFPLSFTPDGEKELALQWLLQSSEIREAVLSCPSVDFSGENRAPARFFLLFEKLYPLSNPPESKKASETPTHSLSSSRSLSHTDNPSSTHNRASSHNTTVPQSPSHIQSPPSDPSSLHNMPSIQKPSSSHSAPFTHAPAGRRKRESSRLTGSSHEIPASAGMTDHAGRTDFVKKQRDISKIFPAPKYSAGIRGRIAQAVREDKEEVFRPFAENSLRHISPSSLSEYAECGFKYSAGRVFHLKKDPTADWELSAMSAGSLQHQFLEKLLSQFPSLTVNEGEMKKLIQEILEQTDGESNFLNAKQIELTADTLKSLGNGFLKKEKERRDRFPHLKPQKGEIDFECFWNEEKGELDREGELIFKGRLDRVDFDEVNSRYVIWDYKKSLSNKTHFTKWPDKNDFQLGLYAQALEKGLIPDLPPFPVEAVAYYGLRDFDYKGYVNKDGPYKDLFGKRSGAVKSREEFEAYQVELNKTVSRLVSGMKAGKFPPEPAKKSSCETCHWRKWCRAKHLN